MEHVSCHRVINIDGKIEVFISKRLKITISRLKFIKDKFNELT